MNERTTRWIIGSVAAALWALTVITAMVDVHQRWYLAILLATFVASLGVLVCLLDAMARAREARRNAAGRAALDQSIKVMCAAVDRHATRMETAVTGHGNRLQANVFTAERWLTNGWRAETLAKIDAADARAAQVGDETGPIPSISGGAR